MSSPFHGSVLKGLEGYNLSIVIVSIHVLQLDAVDWEGEPRPQLGQASMLCMYISMRSSVIFFYSIDSICGWNNITTMLVRQWQLNRMIQSPHSATELYITLSKKLPFKDGWKTSPMLVQQWQLSV